MITTSWHVFLYRMWSHSENVCICMYWYGNKPLHWPHPRYANPIQSSLVYQPVSTALPLPLSLFSSPSNCFFFPLIRSFVPFARSFIHLLPYFCIF